MKFYLKYFFAFIVGIYLVNNIGLPVYYHYCGGHLESVNAIFDSNGCCSDNEDGESDDCCKNETKVISQKSEIDLNNYQYKVTAPVFNLDHFLFLFENAWVNSYLNTFSQLSFIISKSGNGRSILTFKSVLIV